MESSDSARPRTLPALSWQDPDRWAGCGLAEIGEVPDEATTTSAEKWRTISTLALCVIGVGVSGYTLWVHYEPGALICASGGTIDCRAVLTSSESVILGIPIPYFGIFFFITMGALSLPVSWRAVPRWVHLARLATAIAGIGSVIYLLYTELFTVKKICLWCTSVHLITFLLFIIVVTSTPGLLFRLRSLPMITSTRRHVDLKTSRPPSPSHASDQAGLASRWPRCRLLESTSAAGRMGQADSRVTLASSSSSAGCRLYVPAFRYLLPAPGRFSRSFQTQTALLFGVASERTPPEYQYGS